MNAQIQCRQTLIVLAIAATLTISAALVGAFSTHESSPEAPVSVPSTQASTLTPNSPSETNDAVLELVPDTTQTPMCELPVTSATFTHSPYLTNHVQIPETEIIVENTTEVVTTPETTIPVTTQTPTTTVVTTTAPQTTPKPETTKAPKTTKKPETTKAPQTIKIPEDTEFVAFSTYQYNGKTYNMPLSKELQYHTYLMADKYNVPYRVVMGIMGVESTWQADIGVIHNSSGNFIGLGMLSEQYNAKRFASKGIDVYTPEGNIEAMCIVLRENMDEFDEDIHKALMGYNAGPAGAWRQIKKGITQTTYSKRVMAFAESLK